MKSSRQFSNIAVYVACNLIPAYDKKGVQLVRIFEELAHPYRRQTRRPLLIAALLLIAAPTTAFGRIPAALLTAAVRHLVLHFKLCCVKVWLLLVGVGRHDVTLHTGGQLVCRFAMV